MFINRYDAGQRLAELVCKELDAQGIDADDSMVVVGLPRGGVPIAGVVARAIGVPLTIIVCKKIAAPFQPEFALGAVSSTGIVVMNESVRQLFPSLAHYLDNEIARLIKVTKSLEHTWLQQAGMPGRPNFNGKRVIVVDDGVATGMTTLSALRAIKAEKPSYVMLATPVIPTDTRENLMAECDAIVSVYTPDSLHAIGEFYKDFHQVEEEEVVRSLRHGTLNATPSIAQA